MATSLRAFDSQHDFAPFNHGVNGLHGVNGSKHKPLNHEQLMERDISLHTIHSGLHSLISNHLHYCLDHCSDRDLIKFIRFKSESDIKTLKSWMRIIASTMTPQIEQETVIIQEWYDHLLNPNHEDHGDLDDRKSVDSSEDEQYSTSTEVDMDTNHRRSFIKNKRLLMNLDLNTKIDEKHEIPDKVEMDKFSDFASTQSITSCVIEEDATIKPIPSTKCTKTTETTQSPHQTPVKSPSKIPSKICHEMPSVMSSEMASDSVSSPLTIQRSDSYDSYETTTGVSQSGTAVSTPLTAVSTVPPSSCSLLMGSKGKKQLSKLTLSNLLDLPSSWLLHLFSHYFDFNTLLTTLPRVCHRFRTLSGDPNVWKSLKLNIAVIRNLYHEPRRLTVQSHIMNPNGLNPQNGANGTNHGANPGANAGANGTASTSISPNPMVPGLIMNGNANDSFPSTPTNLQNTSNLSNSPNSSISNPTTPPNGSMSISSKPLRALSVYSNFSMNFNTSHFVAFLIRSCRLLQIVTLEGSIEEHDWNAWNHVMRLLGNHALRQIKWSQTSQSSQSTQSINLQNDILNLSHFQNHQNHQNHGNTPRCPAAAVASPLHITNPISTTKEYFRAKESTKNNLNFTVIDTLFVRCRHISRRGHCWLQSLAFIPTVEHIHCAALSRSDDVQHMIYHFDHLKTLNVNILGPRHPNRNFHSHHRLALKSISHLIPRSVTEFAIPVSVQEDFVKECFSRMPLLENLDFFRLTTPHQNVDIDSWACCLSSDTIYHLANHCRNLKKCQLFVKCFKPKTQIWDAVKFLLQNCKGIEMLTIGMTERETLHGLQEILPPVGDQGDDHHQEQEQQTTQVVVDDNIGGGGMQIGNSNASLEYDKLSKRYFDQLKKVPFLRKRFRKFKKKTMKFPKFTIMWCLLT